jgi:hypothetical protein
MSDYDFDDAELVPLGTLLEDLDKRRAREEWLDEVAIARADIERAMGRRTVDDGPVDFVDATTLLATDYGPTPWLVSGLITQGAVTVIGGEPKTAKTWAAFEIAIAVATDTPVWGEFPVRDVDGRGAWLFMCEDGPRSIQNRLKALHMGRGPSLAGWGSRMHVKALGAMHLDDVNAVARYVATVRRGIKPALVVFDPLRDLHSKNEDSSSEMQTIYAMLRAIRTVLGCAVVFVHHAGKSTADGAKRRGGQKLRGSSALHGAVDAGLYLTEPTRHVDETKRKTTMAARVESEVKAAASAGDFGLALEVFDDVNREAVRAQWVVTRGEAVDPRQQAADERADAAVLLAVTRHDARRGGEPLALRELRAITGSRSQIVSAACARLVAAGKVEAVAGARGHPAYRLPVGPIDAPQPLRGPGWRPPDMPVDLTAPEDDPPWGDSWGDD